MSVPMLPRCSSRFKHPARISPSSTASLPARCVWSATCGAWPRDASPTRVVITLNAPNSAFLDYLASPFGSEEWRFLNYGTEGVDHTVKDGVPILNDRGIAERGDLVYLMANMPVLFYPQDPGAVEPAQKLATEIIKSGIDDPSWPLYSPTNVSKLAELRQYGFDRVTSIVTGREPLSALDDLVKEWRSRGGDQTRTEFEQSLKG